MNELEHILITEKEIDLIFVVAKINSVIDKVNQIQNTLYKFTGEF